MLRGGLSAGLQLRRLVCQSENLFVEFRLRLKSAAGVAA
jgi:hypothetical protein